MIKETSPIPTRIPDVFQVQFRLPGPVFRHVERTSSVTASAPGHGLGRRTQRLFAEHSMRITVG